MLPCQPDRFLYAAIGDVHGDLPALVAAVDAARARAAGTERKKKTKNELKIVSGGQTGVDRGALQAAMDLGLDWGGRAPKG